MKILCEGNGSFKNKVNFVDKNNVFLGYDLETDCCEHAGWFISPCEKTCRTEDEEANNELYLKKDLSEYYFVTDYYEEEDKIDEEEFERFIFKITNGIHVLFISLFNCHNGYYGHGFTFTDNEKEIIK